MRVVQISRTGGSEVLEIVERPKPAPGPGKVLVKADSIGVNYFDTLIRTGKYRWMPPLPFVLGNEMAGRVEAIGAGVTALKAGDAVFVAGYEIGNAGGLYADYAAVPEAAAVRLPPTIEMDAATTLTNYQLAWILLHHAARGVEPNHVVVYGAAGGVGTALIDVASVARARVIGVAGGAAKCAFVKDRGAADVIDHTSENIVERVLALTEGHGADIVFDHVAGPQFTEGLKMVGPLGMIVSYAVLGGVPPSDLFGAMRANIESSPAVRCFTMHTYDHMPERRHEAMTAAVHLLAQGKVRPAIGARLPLTDAKTAHDMIASREVMGKIVLKP